MHDDQEKLSSPGIRFAIPPLVFALCGAISLALEWIYFYKIGPLSALGISIQALVFAGFLIGWAGFAFMGWGFFHFKSLGTTTNLIDPASQLVSTGALRFSRNPMYVGFVSLLLGGAVMFDSVPFAAATTVMLLYLDRFVIPREEAYLQAEFGDVYTRYCSRVRRWL